MSKDGVIVFVSGLGLGPDRVNEDTSHDTITGQTLLQLHGKHGENFTIMQTSLFLRLKKEIL